MTFALQKFLKILLPTIYNNLDNLENLAFVIPILNIGTPSTPKGVEHFSQHQLQFFHPILFLIYHKEVWLTFHYLPLQKDTFNFFSLQNYFIPCAESDPCFM